MDKNLNSEGYDLYEITKDQWVLHVKGGNIYNGTFKKLIKYAIVKLGFEMEEIELAIGEMLNKGHNGAHFGMYKTFIFSFIKEFKSVKKAS